MPKIFISYRRSDSVTISGRIDDHLVNAFGRSAVFKDSYSIKPGEDFRGKILETVAQCDAVLVIIGPNWLSATKADNPAVRRLDDPDDWVRAEVEIGLQRDRAIVIPVLVNEAHMPPPDALPLSLRELAFKNAVTVRDNPDFHQDMTKLIAFLKSLDSPNVEEVALPRQESNPIGKVSRPSAASTNPISKGIRLNVGSEVGTRTAVKVAIITGVFALIAAAIGILPNILPLLASPTPTQVGVGVASPTLTFTTLPISTSQPTDLPTFTPANIQSSLTAALTDTLVPTMTSPSPTATTAPTNTLPLTATTAPMLILTPTSSVGAVQLSLFADSETLTLYISERVSLAGLQFGVIDSNGQQQFYALDKAFNVLQMTQGIAEATSCFVYRLSGSSSPLVTSCGPQVFRQDFARADIFWYDAVGNRPRDVAIYNNGNYVALCSAANPTCTINWPAPAPTVNSVVPSATVAAPTVTSVVLGYPCDGQIIFTTGALLNQIKVSPQRNSPSLPPVQQGSNISILAQQRNDSIVWYQISYNNNANRGWIPIDYVVLSNSCPSG